MIRIPFVFILATVFFGSCHNKSAVTMADLTSKVTCKDDCEKKELSCKLTGPELQQRKATVIASLKKEMLESKELSDGYSYRFSGSDTMIDQLTEFVKTERECCDFFTFAISVNGDKSASWLTLTGPEGTKEFIKSELEF